MKRRSKRGYIGTAKILNDSAAVSVADLERTPGHEPLEARKAPRFGSRVDIEFHSYRARLCDPDGVCAKYAIDALVRSGIISDDSAKEVNEVRYRQTKVKNHSEEKTEITITEV